MERKKRWSDFTRGQQAAILAASAVELVLTTTALVDLARRPRARVRGPKPLWVLGCFVQPIGPVAYLAFGRRSSPEDR
ncbi:MAG: PLD nuclease N-terminal domain-containing protein [Acidimicrobiales bacterium]